MAPSLIHFANSPSANAPSCHSKLYTPSRELTPRSNIEHTTAKYGKGAFIASMMLAALILLLILGKVFQRYRGWRFDHRQSNEIIQLQDINTARRWPWSRRDVSGVSQAPLNVAGVGGASGPGPGSTLHVGAGGGRRVVSESQVGGANQAVGGNGVSLGRIPGNDLNDVRISSGPMLEVPGQVHTETVQECMTTPLRPEASSGRANPVEAQVQKFEPREPQSEMQRAKRPSKIAVPVSQTKTTTVVPETAHTARATSGVQATNPEGSNQPRELADATTQAHMEPGEAAGSSRSAEWGNMVTPNNVSAGDDVADEERLKQSVGSTGTVIRHTISHRGSPGKDDRMVIEDGAKAKKDDEYDCDFF